MPTPVTLPTLAWGAPHAAKHALLIHGLGSNGALMWRYGVTLADAGWHATAVDLRERDVQSTRPVTNVASANLKPQPSAPPRTAVEPAKAVAGKSLSYKVKGGDTLWDIARRHKVTIAEIQKWNNLSDPSSVKPGTTLKINKD